MINSIIKNDKKQNNISVKHILDEVYLFPQWEKIKSFSITKSMFLFKGKVLDLDLYRKFSSKNQLEKYTIKEHDGKIAASMDLRIYKDSVYIINFEINLKNNYEQIAQYLMQVAVEKALYNTTEKEVVINLVSNIINKHRDRKFLINNGFIAEKAQSNYEKELFGETYTLKIENDLVWNKRIKQMPILINE